MHSHQIAAAGMSVGRLSSGWPTNVAVTGAT